MRKWGWRVIRRGISEEVEVRIVVGREEVGREDGRIDGGEDIVEEGDGRVLVGNERVGVGVVKIEGMKIMEKVEG